MSKSKSIRLSMLEEQRKMRERINRRNRKIKLEETEKRKKEMGSVYKSHVKHQNALNSLTNWERNQWTRSGKKALTPKAVKSLKQKTAARRKGVR